MKRYTLIIVAFLLGSEAPTDAADQVDVILGPKPSKLEQFAAKELSEQFQKLFQVKVVISREMPKKPGHLILIGNPTTNPAIRMLMGRQWPKLSHQGHLLKSVSHSGGSALVVGGGSPVATLWAVYELGYHFGIRYLLDRDMYPVVTPELKLNGLDTVLEPNLRERTWRTVNDFPIGPESWGLKEHQTVLRQLAKLKYNRVMLSFYPWQPFVDYGFKGVKKKTALSWFGYQYRVDRDTAGRSVFRGAKVFENPDLAGKKTYQEKIAAGTTLAQGIIQTAQELGMTAAFSISPLEFPKEFADVLPKATKLKSLESLVIGPGGQGPDDPELMALVKTKIRAYLRTYPAVDAIYLTMPEFPEWSRHVEQSWKRLDQRTGLSKKISLKELIESARARRTIASGERGVTALKGNIVALDFLDRLVSDKQLFRHKNGKKIRVHFTQIDPALFPVLDRVVPKDVGTLHFIDYTARRVAENKKLIDAVPASSVRSSLILTLADDNVGVLPQVTTHSVHRLVQQIRKQGWNGFSTRYWILGDLDSSAHYLSRASFDIKVTPSSALESLITPMCGEGVVSRVKKALGLIEQATTLIDREAIGFAFPVPGMLMKHYQAGKPSPKWFSEAKNCYLQGMNEMYRANTRARKGGRSYTLGLARRFELGLHYWNCVEALRAAGAAKAKGNGEEQAEQLGKALEAIYDGCEALAAVARGSCDRGVIAVLNQYGYRPLQRELEKLDE